MSRSYHTTRKRLEELERAYFSDKDKHTKAIEQAMQELEKKRRIKCHIQFERRSKQEHILPMDPNTIPIVTVDNSEFIHFPASPDDLRELVKRLPASLSNGLAGIELSLGKYEQTDHQNDNLFGIELKPDPFSGRLGHEIISGVYSGHVMGAFSPSNSKIRLFAFVYSNELPHRQIIEFYLRLNMLMTFVHELGHHFDFTSRVARGRWLADSDDKVETYAESIEHQWRCEYIIPYLEQQYPDDLNAFKMWCVKYIGIEIPLIIIGGNPKDIIFNLTVAFEDFFDDVINGKDLIEARIQYARNLHYVEQYELALQILGQVLTQDSQNVEALILKSDIFVHKEDYADAILLAQKAMDISPDNSDITKVLADAYEGLEQWPIVEQLSNKLMQQYQTKEGKGWYYFALQQRAHAQLEQGKFSETLADLNEIHKAELLPKRHGPRISRFLAETLVKSIDKLLSQNQDLPQWQVGNNLRELLTKQIKLAGNKIKIDWPIE